ncbi:hypothetical protein DY000_02028972 [Brassica cretica]|uniref:Uncharacterized protein n=1 Tax=Brassica cretica TaxID=69181 RepID=A0ABQ7DEN3_BRACR|nr:hypothetical protein DY000_02028972 [Brassica cretica]
MVLTSIWQPAIECGSRVGQSRVAVSKSVFSFTRFSLDGKTSRQLVRTTVGDHEIWPEGIKAAKARRNNAQGKALSDYKSMWELKMEDLATKEKLSKLAILDTLLTKKEPLSETEETEQMGQDYSYTQPSESEEYGLGSADSGYSQT